METCSVLTRLPGDLRLAPEDAARLLDARFTPPLLLGRRSALPLPGRLAELGIAGGATHDALVALTAVEHDTEFPTRDARAKSTYEAVGVRVVVVA